MKLRNTLTITLVLLMLLSLLAGCGAESNTTAAMDYAVEAPAEMAGMTNGSLADSGSGGSTALPESRKWIITVDMSAETEDLDALLAALDEKITELDGYVEDQSIYNGSTYSSRRYRSASLTVRIPAEDVDKFTQNVEGIANVVRKNKNQEDVTLSYVATESRVTALQTEETRLLELMEQAQTMADLLEIEARLTDVRYELERYTSQLRTYDNQIDYATIYLDIEEVQEYTPVAEKTTWERIRDGFLSSLKGLKDGVVEIFVWVLVNLPYLVVYGVIIGGIVLLVKRMKKRRAAKKNPIPPAAPDTESE